MTLENLKIKNIKQNDVLRVLMALIFISAGIFRIFYPLLGRQELITLELPLFFYWPLVLFEIIGGFYILFKGRFWKKVTTIFIIFLIFALLLVIRLDFNSLIKSSSELFVFNPNPTDFFLHFVFIIILITLLIKKE